MKQILFSSLILLFTVSCTSFFQPSIYDPGTSDFDDNEAVADLSRIYHYYKASSNANVKSAFSAIDRKVEFEYFVEHKDSLAKVHVMMTSGFNEGNLEELLFIELKNREQIKIPIKGSTTREYVESKTYSYTTPTTSTRTINDPGGVDVKVQPDGTHTHVPRPASSRTVTVTENETKSGKTDKSQLFNTTTLELDKNTISRIKEHGISYFQFQFEHAQIIIKVNASQSRELSLLL